MFKKVQVSQVTPELNPSGCRCEDSGFNELATDLLKRSVLCILLIVISIVLAVMGIVVLFSAVYSNNGYEYFLTVLCEGSAALLFHHFLKAKVRIVKKIRNTFMTFGEHCKSCSKNTSQNNFLTGEDIRDNSNAVSFGTANIGQWLEHFDAHVLSRTDSKSQGRLSLPCCRSNELRQVLEGMDEDGSSPSAPPLSPKPQPKLF